MVLSDIMRTSVVTIGPDDTANAAWTRMRRRGIRHLVVLDGDQLAGVVSERDLGGRSGSPVRRGRKVRDLMTQRVASATPETSLEDAADLMRANLIGSLPVLDDDERLVGLVTATDVFEALGGREGVGPLSSAERQLLRAPASSKRLGGSPVPRKRATGKDATPRKRGRATVSEPRAPLARRVSKATKQTAGRTSAEETPASIRVTGVSLDQEQRAEIRQKLGARLGKFAGAIERVTVRVEDVNGPRGGVDQACRIKVVLSGLPSVVVEQRAASLPAALSGAISSAERTVRRAVQRSRA